MKILRFLFPDPAASSSAVLAIGYPGARFRIIGVQATLDNADITICQAWLRLGTVTDPDQIIATGPGLPASSGGVYIQFWVQSPVVNSPAIPAGAPAAGFMPEFWWESAIRVEIASNATSFGFSAVSIILEVDDA
jgi:hypothetical protein